MKKKTIIIIILLLVVFAVASFFLFWNNEYNKQIELTLKTNGGVPYKWEYEIEDESIVKYVKNYTLESDKDIDGGVVLINYVFEGVKPGKTKLTFKYVNITNNEVDKEQVYNLKVNNKKGISLVALP